MGSTKKDHQELREGIIEQMKNQNTPHDDDKLDYEDFKNLLNGINNHIADPWPAPEQVFRSKESYEQFSKAFREFYEKGNNQFDLLMNMKEQKWYAQHLRFDKDLLLKQSGDEMQKCKDDSYYFFNTYVWQGPEDLTKEEYENLCMYAGIIRHMHYVGLDQLTIASQYYSVFDYFNDVKEEYEKLKNVMQYPVSKNEAYPKLKHKSKYHK